MTFIWRSTSVLLTCALAACGGGGGSGGSGGQAGSAGSGGDAGSGGSSGDGGSAGAAGASGSNGTAGSAGAAGASGSAGTGGSAGAGGTAQTNLPPLTGVGAETLAGDGVPGSQDGTREFAHFNNPVNVLLGPSGRVYVADFDNGLIRKVTTTGDVTTFAQAAGFARPFGLTFLDGGDLLVQTDYNTTAGSTGALWRVDTAGVTTLQVNDSGRARGLATLSDGRVVMSFFLQHRLAIFDPTTKAITHLAGSEASESGFVNDTGNVARFATPYGVVVLPGDEILVADQDNHVIRKVTLAGVVTTFAGNGSVATTDGDLLTAAFNQPQGLAVDGTGNVYVSEAGGNVIRKITSTQVSTIAGDGTQGWLDAATPLTARFYGLEGISVSSDGSALYVADGNRGDDSANHRVRVVHLQ